MDVNSCYKTVEFTDESFVLGFEFDEPQFIAAVVIVEDMTNEP